MTTAFVTPQSLETGDLRGEVLGAFRGAIQPVPVSPLYRLGLAVVAVAMVLLPLVYLGLIALAGFGVVWFAMHGWSLLDGISSLQWRGFGFVVPLVTGTTLILFMVKPLFARTAAYHKPLVLSPADETLLFAFVQRVCETVRAPLPSEIRVDGMVNASASFRRGIFSLFSGDLVLTLGLPLVAGLSLPQCAGILAHEFGHFSQRTAMRFSYVIRSINAWFARVVYERDRWDAELLAAFKKSDYRIQIVLGIALAFVWLIRKILWALMMLGHVLSSFLLRQMEFDADRYEARLVGCAVARSTFREMFGLTLTNNNVLMQLQAPWREGKLSDRLPRLVASTRDRLLPEIQGFYETHLAEAKTGLFDSHPSDRDRIESLEREGEAGIFACGLPATILFSDFEAVERAFTVDLYRKLWGETFDEHALASVEELVAAGETATAEARTVQRYLGRDAGAVRPFPLARQLPEAPADPVAALREAREAMAAQRSGYQEEVQAYEKAGERLLSLSIAETALRAGLTVQPKTFGLSGSDLHEAVQEREKVVSERANLASRLEARERIAARRLLIALGLLGSAGVDVAQEEVRRSLSCLIDLNAIYPRLADLCLLIPLLGNLQKWIQFMPGTLREEADRARGMLQRIAQELKDRPYPFADRPAGLTLTAFAALDRPIPEGIGDVIQTAGAAVSDLLALYTRLLAHLADVAERVEAAYGLEPLTD